MDESLLPKKELIYRYFEENIEDNYRWAEEGEWEGLICLTALDADPATTSLYKFKNINSDSLEHILYRKHENFSQKFNKQQMFEVFKMALCKDISSAVMGKHLLTQYVLSNGYYATQYFNTNGPMIKEFITAIKFLIINGYNENDSDLVSIYHFLHIKHYFLGAFLPIFKNTEQYGFYQMILDHFFPNLLYKKVKILG
ncbi:MAG TPA: hypothetical protein PKX31_00385 [Chitinophagaceae bacterium]|nr:hypothetical protein [Chitinophagaceae bacterium]